MRSFPLSPPFPLLLPLFSLPLFVERLLLETKGPGRFGNGQSPPRTLPLPASSPLPPPAPISPATALPSFFTCCPRSSHSPPRPVGTICYRSRNISWARPSFPSLPSTLGDLLSTHPSTPLAAIRRSWFSDSRSRRRRQPRRPWHSSTRAERIPCRTPLFPTLPRHANRAADDDGETTIPRPEIANMHVRRRGTGSWELGQGACPSQSGARGRPTRKGNLARQVPCRLENRPATLRCPRRWQTPHPCAVRVAPRPTVAPPPPRLLSPPGPARARRRALTPAMLPHPPPRAPPRAPPARAGLDPYGSRRRTKHSIHECGPRRPHSQCSRTGAVALASPVLPSLPAPPPPVPGRHGSADARRRAQRLLVPRQVHP